MEEEGEAEEAEAEDEEEDEEEEALRVAANSSAAGGRGGSGSQVQRYSWFHDELLGTGIAMGLGSLSMRYNSSDVNTFRTSRLAQI